MHSKIIFVFMLAMTPSVYAQVPPNRREQLEKLIYSVKGSDLFRAHCAPCHDENGDGLGPLAPALKNKVPDLRVLAANNKGIFPDRPPR
jgi:mono/diheme cytochrome c family protein